MQMLRAQGATEYLVLLAVVLVIALVGIALLGFFPGMASDAQITQSQIYWESASPVSIVESGARVYTTTGNTFLYLRLRNSGTYPIRITGIVGGDGAMMTQFQGFSCGAPNPANISDYFYLAPGEEKHFGWTAFGSTLCNWYIYSRQAASSPYAYVGGASSVCQNSSVSPGTLDYKTLGFEYIAYVEGQQVTKREIGKEFVIKCLQPQ